MKPINLKKKFASFSDYWSPKIIADLNDDQVKCAKFKGDFIWHQHDADEMFLVTKGSVTVKFEKEPDQIVNEGELIIIPKKVRHCPVAKEEAHVVIIEPSHICNTGDVQDSKTIKKLPRI